MDDWKSLPVEEKVKQLGEYQFGRRSQDKIAELYAEALNDGNAAAIAKLESFGDHLRAIVENYAEFSRGRLFFGFNKKELDAAGWLKKPEWLDVERIEFGKTIKKLLGLNYISLGCGPNGQWTYGVSAGNFNSGYVFGLSVWNETYSSRQECLAAGLEELLAWHNKRDKKDKNPVIIGEIRSMLASLTGEKRVRLSAFELAMIGGVGVSHA